MDDYSFSGLNFISLFVLCSFQLLNTFPFIVDVCNEFRKARMYQWYEANSLPDLLSAMQGKFDEVYKLHEPLKQTLMWGTRVENMKS